MKTLHRKKKKHKKNPILWGKFPKGAPLIDEGYERVLWQWEGDPARIGETSGIEITNVICVGVKDLANIEMIGRKYNFSKKNMDNLTVAPPGHINNFLTS